MSKLCTIGDGIEFRVCFFFLLHGGTQRRTGPSHLCCCVFAAPLEFFPTVGEFVRCLCHFSFSVLLSFLKNVCRPNIPLWCSPSKESSRVTVSLSFIRQAHQLILFTDYHYQIAQCICLIMLQSLQHVFYIQDKSFIHVCVIRQRREYS